MLAGAGVRRLAAQPAGMAGKRLTGVLSSTRTVCPSSTPKNFPSLWPFAMQQKKKKKKKEERERKFGLMSIMCRYLPSIPEHLQFQLG